MKFEDTSLWKRGLENKNDGKDDERERLRSVYKVCWDNSCRLADQIAREIPSLTLHNEAHFESLWRRADQIAGSKLELTPLETFVFGVSILLHDAANTSASYEGRLSDIQESDEWRDIVSDMFGEGEQIPEKLEPEAFSQALLLTLRILHGRRAEKLGGIEFVNQSTGKTSHLIPDDDIRNNLGSLIGLISASHHWNVRDLERRFQTKIVAGPAWVPSDWTVRPILIACLLRCSDAVQIDQSRAPDFLYAILRLRGLSELHWRAQNRLRAPVIDPDDEKSLVFSASSPFDEKDADAWWICYDAIQVAHRELQSCSVLLNDLRLPSFAIDRVRDAEAPLRLAKHLTVRGWRPVPAQIKINNVSHVVEMFGGSRLYGRELSIPVREMIQNAVDAVNHRRRHEKPESDYDGRINIRVEHSSESGVSGIWLRVEDNGIGMSEDVLTGPLIDFGSSYISSDLAKAERPGLSAKGRKRIGRFGVGFFSVFMLSDRVLVSSRPYDEKPRPCGRI